jgi:Protein of unknown function (DUF1552)
VTTRSLSRRDWLRAAGAAAGLFPFLRPRPAHAAAQPALILLMQSNGTGQSNFWPAPGTFLSPILEPILGNPALAPSATVCKGLINHAGGSGNGHDQGFTGLYSGHRSVGTFNDPWGSGISLDQILKKQLPLTEPFPTLNCGVLASDTPPFKAHRRSFSYTSAKQQVPTEVDPYKLYAQLFSAGTPAGGDPVAASKRRLLYKRTVLDAVSQDLKSLRQRVGAFDRDRLDAHQTALREMELRLGATLSPDAGLAARCGGVPVPAEGLDIEAEVNVPHLVPMMFDVIALALACQLTRVVTFQFGHGGEKWYFKWLGINENSHDDIAHRDDGKSEAVTGKLLKMNVWYAQQVAYLARALQALPAAEGTVLDRSLVVWGNEIATGPHGMDDIPVVLLGKAAGRLRGTGLMVDQGPQDYHRLGCTLLNLMGVAAPGFGEEPACGPVQGLSI